MFKPFGDTVTLNDIKPDGIDNIEKWLIDGNEVNSISISEEDDIYVEAVLAEIKPINDKKSNKAPLIIGIVIGCIVLTSICAISIVLVKKKRN